MARYTFSASLPGSVDDVRERVNSALKAEGFGVLTEIDVAATLKARMGIERPPYLILGACNPGLAHRALGADPSIGALLPCNIVLRQGTNPSETIVEILDPLAALGIADEESIAPIATEAAERLRRVHEALARA
jgi:uncharacterized protein (DUF302 family)